MKVVIVEDSRLARNELRELLDDCAGWQLAGEAENVAQAVPLIDTVKPELLLLDIHLPDGDGFAVLDQLQHVPQVIFTTAYDQYALRAFEVNALDYLLKPIEAARLQEALKRAENAAKTSSLAAIADSGDTAPQRKSRQDQIFIRDGERCHFVRLADVFLFEVDGNYTRVCFRDQRPLLARALGYLEERLDARVFFRANRQQIINLDYIAGVENWVGDGLLVSLKNGARIEVSRRQARELRTLMEL